MVSLGTPVDAPGYKGITPLMGAASEQQVGAMIVLLELGANPNAQDEFGYTALHRIAGSGRVTYLQTGTGASGPAATQAAQALLDAHASIDTPDSRGQTPLHAAVAANDVEMARFLLAKNANPSTGDRDGETTLGLAIDAGAVQMAKVLLDGGADLARKDQFGRTYLHLAARKGSVEIVTFLLGKDSVKRAINEKDSDGNTAWDVATGPVAHAIDAAGGRTGRKTPYYTPSFDFSLQPDTPTAVETTETPETSGPSPDAESPGVPGSSIP
jgi:ankyrin repeat protein